MPSYAVTGASRGLGLEFINQISSNPANTVFALVRTPDTATDLQQLAKAHKNVHVVQADLTKSETLSAAAAAVGNVTGGSLDVLINNAANTDPASMGIAPTALTPDKAAFAREAFHTSFETDIFGGIWVTNAFLPLIEKGTEKKIIHLNSGMSDLEVINKSEIPYALPYSVAKAGLAVVAAKFAVELRDKGIKVLSLSPGWVNTRKGEITPEEKAMLPILLAHFQKVDPRVKQQTTPEESVRDCLQVIDKLDEKLSGSFVSQHGNREWF